MTDSSAPKKMLVKQVLLKQDRKKEEDKTFEQIAFERETRMVEKENTHPTHPTHPTLLQMPRTNGFFFRGAWQKVTTVILQGDVVGGVIGRFCPS